MTTTNIDTSISPYEVGFVMALTRIGDTFSPTRAVEAEVGNGGKSPPKERVKEIYPHFILTERGNTYLWADMVMSYRKQYRKGAPIDEDERKRDN